MLDKFKVNITNSLYSVPSKVKIFRRKNPGLKVLAAGATKARKMEGSQEPGYELGWAASRRSVLILASDGLHCGNWFVPLADIHEAKLLRISGGLILKISTLSDLSYQFGLQYDPAWENQTTLQLEKENVVLKYSITSLIIRLLFPALFTWHVVQDITYQNIDVTTYIYIFFTLVLIVPIIKNLLMRR